MRARSPSRWTPGSMRSGNAPRQKRQAWTTALGPVPDDPTERLEWTRRAGVIAGYREEQATAAPPSRSAPHLTLGHPRRGQSWLAAYEALGRPSEHRDVIAAGDGELR